MLCSNKIAGKLALRLRRGVACISVGDLDLNTPLTWRIPNSLGLTFFSVCLGIWHRLRGAAFCARPHIATHFQILYTSGVEYPFPPVGIVGAAVGKNRRAFLFACASCFSCASV